MTLETALNAELDEHLGYDKHEQSTTKNSRNGYSSKTLQTEDGQFELKTPSDRNNDFEPEIVKKKQRRFVSMCDKILFHYAAYSGQVDHRFWKMLISDSGLS